MRKQSKRKNLIAQFDHPMRVTVQRGEFEPIESIGLLDLKKLKRGSHKVHIGSVTGGCCATKVYATVRKGNVVDMHMEACKEHDQKKRKLTTEAKAIIKEVKRRGHLKKRRSKWTSVPVDEFFSSPRTVARIIISDWETEGGGCMQVCWGDPPILDCVYCCRDWKVPGKDELECGFVQVVVGDIFK
jgi:hypothetical protein